MKYFAIIVAGGSGTRMNTEMPKQFLLLQQKPVMMHTIAAFAASPYQPEIIVVLNKEHFPVWKQLCDDFMFDMHHQLVAGGKTRFESVKNALNTIEEDAIIAIHDAVRPLIRTPVIDLAYQKTLEQGNAVVAVPSKDSVRWCSAGGVSKSLNRNEVYLVQTPQVFRSAMIKNAYEQAYSEDFTDDASVAERAGTAINLLQGDQNNFKITFPADLHLAELILNEKSR